jgi:hypothetical protein
MNLIKNHKNKAKAFLLLLGLGMALLAILLMVREDRSPRASSLPTPVEEDKGERSFVKDWDGRMIEIVNSSVPVWGVGLETKAPIAFLSSGDDACVTKTLSREGKDGLTIVTPLGVRGWILREGSALKTPGEGPRRGYRLTDRNVVPVVVHARPGPMVGEGATFYYWILEGSDLGQSASSEKEESEEPKKNLYYFESCISAPSGDTVLLSGFKGYFARCACHGEIIHRVAVVQGETPFRALGDMYERLPNVQMISHAGTFIAFESNNGTSGILRASDGQWVIQKVKNCQWLSDEDVVCDELKDEKVEGFSLFRLSESPVRVLPLIADSTVLIIREEEGYISFDQPAEVDSENKRVRKSIFRLKLDNTDREKRVFEVITHEFSFDGELVGSTSKFFEGESSMKKIHEPEWGGFTP